MNELLPEIRLPDGFPAWLIEAHDAQDDTRFGRVEMSAGHARMRRVYSSAPQRRNVSMLLTEAQASEFFAFFENDLIAGAERFAAKVRALGPDHLWYGAMFVSPYRASMLHTGRPTVRWKVEAELLLFGAGSMTAPGLTSMRAAIAVPLLAGAIGTTTKTLSAAIAVALSASADDPRMSADIVVGLAADVLPEGVLAMSSAVAVGLEAQAIITRVYYLRAALEVSLDGSVN